MLSIRVCHAFGFDPPEVILEKLEINEKKYPVEYGLTESQFMEGGRVMHKKAFLIVASCLGLCLIVWLSDVRAESFDDIFVVQPAGNEGGTFYLQLEKDGRTGRHPRAGYLPAMTLVKVIRAKGQVKEMMLCEERHGRECRLFPIDPKSYKSVEVVTDHDLITRMQMFISRFFSEVSTDEIARGLRKECNAKLSISVKLKAGVGGNFKIADLSLAGEGTYLWEWKQGYRYTLETYRGFQSNQESDVFKTIRCEEESSTDWYAHRFVVTNIGGKDEPFEIFQHTIEGKLGRYFEKPDTTGVAGTAREHMVALKRAEDGSTKNFFEAFAALDSYLENAFFKDVEISAVEKLQFKNLIIRLIVDWSKS